MIFTGMNPAVVVREGKMACQWVVVALVSEFEM
jgi:hypothetical protein